MQRAFWYRLGGGAAPAGSVVGIAIVLALAARYGHAEAPAGAMGAWWGWLGLLLLANTAATILAGYKAGESNARADVAGVAANWARWLMGVLLLMFANAALLGVAEVRWDFGGVGGWFRVTAVINAWTLLWAVVAALLARWGAGVAVGLTTALAMVLLGGPVTLMPLVRAAQGHPILQARLVESIGIACPALAALDSVRPAVQINWTTLPWMYTLSGLGQDVPVDLPRWWISAAGYTGAAAAGVVLFYAVRRNPGGRLVYDSNSREERI